MDSIWLIFEPGLYFSDHIKFCNYFNIHSGYKISSIHIHIENLSEHEGEVFFVILVRNFGSKEIILFRSASFMIQVKGKHLLENY